LALKPTIYKFKISLSDMDRNYYDTLTLTLAKHPSETDERLMARLLAFCINAEEHLTFSTGLSTPEDPDIWAHSLDGQITSWIEIGEPAPEKIKKASRICPNVKVYSFNSRSNVWWNQESKHFLKINAQYFRFSWQAIQQFALLLDRTMEFSISISGDSAYISAAKGECEVTWKSLTQAE